MVDCPTGCLCDRFPGDNFCNHGKVIGEAGIGPEVYTRVPGIGVVLEILLLRICKPVLDDGNVDKTSTRTE